MARLKNTNPLGAVDLYVLGLAPIHLEAGDEFEVPDDEAARLLEQVGNYEAVTTDTAKKG